MSPSTQAAATPPGPAFASTALAAAFAAHPPALRQRLLTLRALVFEVAAATEGVGAIEETLKWGQPSYLTAETGSGSTVRIDAFPGAAPRYAAFFHCRTDLVASFRALYPDALAFSGDRAVVFGLGDPLPVAAVRHCIALALTYHLRKRKGRRP